jgi:tRNA guanosine-2'-O-methyltransferase
MIWLSLPFHIQLLVSCDISFAVAFDEDFEGELADNLDARSEVSLLAKSTSPELTEVSYLI